jgi:hypothetical protein
MRSVQGSPSSVAAVGRQPQPLLPPPRAHPDRLGGRRHHLAHEAEEDGVGAGARQVGDRGLGGGGRGRKGPGPPRQGWEGSSRLQGATHWLRLGRRGLISA